MFNIEFAYTGQMQTILTCFNFLSTFVCHSVTAVIILEIYGEKASRLRIIAFAFFAGTLLNNVWTYGIYILGGRLDFDALTYAFVTVPNPFFALLYYFIGFKALNLSPIRSIRLMGHAYLYILSYKSLVLVVGNLFFPQPSGLPYNFLLDAVSLLVKTIIILAISLAILKIVRRRHFNIVLRDSMFVKSVPFEITYSFVVAAFVYAIMVVPQIFMKTDRLWGTAFSTLAIILIFLMDVILDINRVQHSILQNKNAYISSLVKSIDDFRGFKHDINNVLQTYSGYISIGDLEKLSQYHETVTQKTLYAESALDLAKRMEECPAIVSLLMEKLDYADRSSVDLKLQIAERIIAPDYVLVDICRCLACLLDNAIEAAAQSQRKRVIFLEEKKENGNRLIVITNSTNGDIDPTLCCQPGFTTKENHAGMGLANVRRIVDKQPNWTLNISHYNNEFSVFIELLQPARGRQ